MCVLIFPTTLSDTIFILRRTEPDMIQSIYWPKRARYSCQILMKLEFSWEIFAKYSKIKIHKNPSSWSHVFPCRWTDGQTGMTKLIVAFRNCENALKKCIFWRQDQLPSSDTVASEKIFRTSGLRPQGLDTGDGESPNVRAFKGKR